MKIDKEIQDDELRIIGRKDDGSGKSRGWIWALCITLALAAVATGYFLLAEREADGSVDCYEDYSENDMVGEDGGLEPSDIPIGDYSDTLKAYTEHLRQTINDIGLDIYIPHNARPSLSIGPIDCNDKTLVLAVQAADIRADNGKINGAFILEGTPVSWGLSKKGYVAIIGDKISIGVSDNTPLFEEATEKGGSFFRQYPLVKDGIPVENKPKGKAIRKAICERRGEIMVVFSVTPESFHDFSEALADLGVGNAVYLVGSELSYGFYRDESEHLIEFAPKSSNAPKFENYISWRSL
ncbi:MAG: hypothetical protein ACI39U_02585 [Candidatus Cryptobacteroides sp.]